MTFNLNKNAQKVKDSVTPQSSALPANAKKYNLSLQDTSVTSYNSLLEKDRRPIEGTVVTHEAMLDEKRNKASNSDKVTEAALEEADSALYPHRQFKDGEDNYHVAPIAALAHANDRKYRDAFSKINKGADTAFWDKYIGDQLDGPITKVPSNLPQSGSQLSDNPERFGKLKNLPLDSSAKTNRDNFAPGLDVAPMQGFSGKEKALEMTLASLKDADGLLFGIYLKASKENRKLSKDEQEIVTGINKDKVFLLRSFAQITPPSPIPQSNPEPEPSPGSNPPTHPEREVDFLDGSPDVTNDPSLWARQSGFDPAQADMDREAEDFNGFGLDDQIPSPEDTNTGMPGDSLQPSAPGSEVVPPTSGMPGPHANTQPDSPVDIVPSAPLPGKRNVQPPQPENPF